MQKIKNIIFDYGNVIFDIDHKLTLQAFEEIGVSNAHDIFGHLSQATFFDEFEKGLISPTEFRDHVRDLSHKNLSDEAIDHAWNALLIGVPAHYWEILSGFKKQGYRLLLLSNNNAIHYKWIQDYLLHGYGMSDMGAFFEREYYSHFVGMRKPNADIFELVLSQNNLLPDETLFVDDTPAHLATAKQLGIHTYWMEKGVKTLEDFVKEML